MARIPPLQLDDENLFIAQLSELQVRRHDHRYCKASKIKLHLLESADDKLAISVVENRNVASPSTPGHPLREAAQATLGFIDVPGHERRACNMLAGAAGVDLALLVIAADDGGDAANSRTLSDPSTTGY